MASSSYSSIDDCPYIEIVYLKEATGVDSTSSSLKYLLVDEDSSKLITSSINN